MKLATQQHSAFTGIDNQSLPYALPEGRVLAADNLNFDVRGRARRRDGYTQVYPATHDDGPHSLFNYRDERLYYREGDALFVVEDPANDTPEMVVDGFVPGEPLAMVVDTEGWIYWTDTYYNGAIAPDGTPTGWAPPHPSYAPAVRVNMGRGGFHGPATMKVCCTFVDAWGRESGSDTHHTVEVTEADYFNLTVTPPALPPGAVLARIYAAPPNSSEYAKVEGNIIEPGSFTKGHPTRNRYAPLPGHIIRHWMNRLLIASDYAIQWTDPASFLSNFERNSFLMDQRVIMLRPLENGFYAGTLGGVWFASGRDPAKVILTKVHDAAPYEGMDVEELGEHLPFDGASGLWAVWPTSDGIIAGSPNGEVRNITDKYIPRPTEIGASLAGLRDGMHQIVFSGAAQ